jgi:chain length determinant protein tyrosine kinase EpsG
MVKNASYTGKSADRSIGAILIDSGRLSPDDTERVLEYQKESQLRFGEAGVKLGLLTEADILFALSLQFDYPFLSGPSRPVSEDVVVAYRPFGNEGERLRALRSQLQLRWFDESGMNSALAVVGPHRGEGRSYLAANLAVSFAQAGERTLLIDADLHNASQHRLFKLENGAGLSNLLAGQVQDGMVQFVAGIPGLAVLPSGPLPPNPQELLARPVFARLLEQSASTFSVVIVDTPAMEEGIDATLLSRATRAALVVARTHLTRTDAFSEAAAMVADIGAKVIGSVLVDVEPAPRRRGKLS